MNSRRDMLELVCELNDEEVLVRARAGATCEEELVKLASAKDAFMSAHKRQVAEQQGMADRMTKCVRTGKEMRLIECITEFHAPNVGMKRTTRLDTGEFVKEESMSSYELQENLFVDPSTDVPQGAVDAALAGIALESGAKSAACEHGVHNVCASKECSCDCHVIPPPIAEVKEAVVSEESAGIREYSPECYEDRCSECRVQACGCNCHLDPLNTEAGDE